MSEFTHTRHLEHDTERKLNKDASCSVGMRRHVEKKKEIELLFPLEKKEKEDIRSILRDTVAPNKHCFILPRFSCACARFGGWEEDGNPASGVLLSGISLHPCMLLLRLPLEPSFLSPGFSGSSMVSLSVLVCVPHRFTGVNEPLPVLWDCVSKFRRNRR